MKLFLIFLCMAVQNTCAVFDAYQAHKLYQAGDKAAAQQRYTQMVVDNQKDWRALYNLGTIALNEQQYDDAISHFEKVVALQPENKQAQERLAIARKLQGERKKEEQKRQQDQQQKKDDQRNNEQQDKKENSSDQGKQEQKQQERDQQSSPDKDTKQSSQDTKTDQQSQEEQRNDPAEQQQKQQKQQAQKDAAEEARKNEAEKRRAEVAQQRAQQSAEQNKKFSKQDMQLMEKLDDVDQQVQRAMVRYAVAQNESQTGEQHASRKNW